MYDYLIKNGRIVDGGGTEAYLGDIAIKGNKIVDIGRLSGGAGTVLDAAGRYVTPGFIDIHRHADAIVFKDEFGETEIRQGLTSIVNGNCGLSMIPCPKSRRKEIFSFLKPVIGNVVMQEEFDDYASYIKALKKQKLPIHVGMLLGNGTVRAAVRGYETGRLSAEELSAAREYIRSSLEAGAPGISLGIVYAPEYNYSADEFVEVLEPMKDYGVPLVTHIRGEGDIFAESVREVIGIAERLSVPLHISHLKCIGKRNWGHGVDEVLQLIRQARENGLDATCDVYPYTAGSTQLIQILPPEYLEGGFAEIVRRLKNPARRRELTEILKKPSSSFENLVSSIGFSNIRISSVETEKNKAYVGKSIEEIAAAVGKEPYECTYDLLVDENCNIAMVDFITSEEDIVKILKFPCASIISDTVYPEGGIPHPRMYGTFPKILKKYVREDKILSIEEAVRKMTSLPASLYGFSSKGRIKKGMDADLLIFDLDKIETKADYENPRCLATGFSYIFVDGVMAVKDDVYLHTKSGRILNK